MIDQPSTSGRAAEPFRRAKKADFSFLDGRSVAVILRQKGKQVVYQGTALLQRDDALGNVLSITPTDSQPGDPKLILTETDWRGRIIPDLEYGCEICMIPHA